MFKPGFMFLGIEVVLMAIALSLGHWSRVDLVVWIPLFLSGVCFFVLMIAALASWGRGHGHEPYIRIITYALYALMISQALTFMGFLIAVGPWK